MKYILGVALIATFLTVSSMAQDAHVYQGGPKTSNPHVMTQATSAAEAFAMVPKEITSHRYSGGPQTVVPHAK